MEKSKTTLIGIAFLAMTASGAVCGKNSGTTQTGTGNTEATSANFFLSAAQQVAPTFGSSSSIAISAESISELPVGSILYSIHEALRDYEFPRDEGVIDMHNIYKVLTTSGQIYETAESSCLSITEAAVLSPFDLGLNSETYNCAGNFNTMADGYANGFAIRDAGNIKHGLLTYRWAPEAPDHLEHGILQGSYDENTKNLNVRMIHLVEYAAQGGFVVRSHIVGNEETHAFSLNLLSAGIGESSGWVSLVGKGVSKGAGQYFLFKVQNSSGVDGKYFCFPADATETDLIAMHEENPEGAETVDANCADYQSDVDAMIFLATADAPTALSDLMDSSILLDF